MNFLDISHIHTLPGDFIFISGIEPSALSELVQHLRKQEDADRWKGVVFVSLPKDASAMSHDDATAKVKAVLAKYNINLNVETVAEDVLKSLFTPESTDDTMKESASTTS